MRANFTLARTALALVAAALAVPAAAEARTPAAAVVLEPCSTTRSSTIRVGETKRGTLTNSSCMVEDGTFADVYRFEVRGTQMLQIDMQSGAFDAYLKLLDANGQRLAVNDDGGGGTHARITRSFTQGTYYVFANTVAKNEMGAYTLTVGQMSAEAAARTCQTGNAIAMQVGETRRGTLSSQSCVDPDGTWAQMFRLDVSQRGPVTIEMRATGFDTFLKVLDASSNTLASNDDGAGGTDSRIVRDLAPGTYYLYANTITNPTADGSFSISAQAGGTPGAAGASEDGGNAPRPDSPMSAGGGSSGGSAAACRMTAERESIGLGETKSGTLGPASCRTSDGTYANIYRLQVGGRQPVVVEMRSGAFDSYLVLLSEDGTPVQSDDDGAGGTDSRITVTLQPGTYYVRANSLTQATGAYTLSVR